MKYIAKGVVNIKKTGCPVGDTPNKFRKSERERERKRGWRKRKKMNEQHDERAAGDGGFSTTRLPGYSLLTFLPISLIGMAK